MNADQRLTNALVKLADHGQRPRCSDPGDGRWLSDDPEERAAAATLCAGCPVWDECGAAADARSERFGVWAGLDRGGSADRGRRK